jgi:predicted nucleotidyltransferase
MKTFEEIRTILHAHTDDLRTRYGMTNLAVFGSVVRGEAREDSDVDILADVPASMSLLGIVSVENYLCELLGMKVDFIPRSDVRRELKDQILSDAVMV